MGASQVPAIPIVIYPFHFDGALGVRAHCPGTLGAPRVQLGGAPLPGRLDPHRDRLSLLGHRHRGLAGVGDRPPPRSDGRLPRAPPPSEGPDPAITGPTLPSPESD